MDEKITMADKMNGSMLADQNNRFKLRLSKKYLVLIIAFAVVALLAVAQTIHSLKHEKESVNRNLLAAIADFNAGKKDEAIGAVEKLYKKNRENDKVKYCLAGFYYQTKQYNQFLDFVSKNSLKSTDIYTMSANTYRSQNNLAKAEQSYTEAIKSDPGNVSIYVTASAYYQSQLKYDQALSVLEKGIAANPNSPKLLISAASVSLKAGNTDKAKTYANQVLEIEPNNAQAKTILAKL